MLLPQVSIDALAPSSRKSDRVAEFDPLFTLGARLRSFSYRAGKLVSTATVIGPWRIRRLPAIRFSGDFRPPVGARGSALAFIQVDLAPPVTRRYRCL